MRNLQVEELYSLDDDAFRSLTTINTPISSRTHHCGDGEVFGLIFLFKWSDDVAKLYIESQNTTNDTENITDEGEDDASTEIYFANQIIDNACATQAILSILMNIPTFHPTDTDSNGKEDPTDRVHIGHDLEFLKEFTKDFSPQLKGLTIGNMERLVRVHNSFARPNVLTDEQWRQKSRQKSGNKTKSSKKKSKKEQQQREEQDFDIEEVLEEEEEEEGEIYHFTSYVPINGRVYELDGLQPAPIPLGTYSDNKEWWRLARPAIEKRLKLYGEMEFRFNLLAVIKYRRVALRKELHKWTRVKDMGSDLLVKLGGDQLETSGADVDAKVKDLTADEALGQLGTDSVQSDAHQTSLILNLAQNQVSALTRLLKEESQKRQQYHVENTRRRHDYIPFIRKYLELLHSKGLLEGLVRQAA